MGTNIMPFPQNGGLPSYLKKASKIALEAFTAGVGAGYKVLSIKGKVFTLVEGGERRVIPDPNDPDEPARSLLVTLLASSVHLSKAFYHKGYEEGVAEKPDCSSADGIRPDPGVPDPQSKTCAACPHNVWGTGQAGKGKKCPDARRIAVAAAGSPDQPMLLRVPPASLKPLAEYATYVYQRGVPIQGVVTKIRFRTEESSPVLQFSADGLLPEDAFEKAQATAESDEVKQILGLVTTPSEPAVDVSEEEAEEALEKPAQKAKPTPKPVQEVEEDDEDDEDEEEAPKPAPKAKPKAKAKAAVDDDTLDELNASLDSLLEDAFDD